MIRADYEYFGACLKKWPYLNYHVTQTKGDQNNITQISGIEQKIFGCQIYLSSLMIKDNTNTIYDKIISFVAPCSYSQQTKEKRTVKFWSSDNSHLESVTDTKPTRAMTEFWQTSRNSAKKFWCFISRCNQMTIMTTKEL